MTERPTRGVVYSMDLGHGAKPWLVVSNNSRNGALDTVILLRITTTVRAMPTRIDLTSADPLVGQVLCDDIEQVYIDELGDRLGALSQPTMHRVAAGLRIALAV